MIFSPHLLLWWCSYELSALLFQPSMLGCVGCILLCTVTRPSYLPYRFLFTKDAALQSHLLTCYCGGVATNWAHFYFNLQCLVALVVLFCALCTSNVRSRFLPFGDLFLLAYWRMKAASDRCAHYELFCRLLESRANHFTTSLSQRAWQYRSTIPVQISLLMHADSQGILVYWHKVQQLHLWAWEVRKLEQLFLSVFSTRGLESLHPQCYAVSSST